MRKLLLLLALCAGSPLLAQTTVTAADISFGGQPIAAGFVSFTPVDKTGAPISFIQSGGGLNLAAGGFGAFTCTITSGAIVQPCTVPDASLSSPVVLYSIQITSNGSSPRSVTLPQVSNVQGSTWALDHYAPAANTTTTQVTLYGQGTGAPPSACTAPYLYTQINAAAGSNGWLCVNGTMVQQVGTGTGGSSLATQSVVAHQWFNSFNGTTFGTAQPAYTDLTGTPTIPTTVASLTRLASDYSGIYDASGAASTAQTAAEAAFTGDVTKPAGSFATTLAASGATAGTYGSSSLVPVLTVNAKGLVTSVTTAAVSGGSSLPNATAANQVPVYPTSGSNAVTPESLTPALVGLGANEPTGAVFGNCTTGSAVPGFCQLTAAMINAAFSSTTTDSYVALSLGSSDAGTSSCPAPSAAHVYLCPQQTGGLQESDFGSAYYALKANLASPGSIGLTTPGLLQSSGVGIGIAPSASTAALAIDAGAYGNDALHVLNNGSAVAKIDSSGNFATTGGIQAYYGNAVLNFYAGLGSNGVYLGYNSGGTAAALTVGNTAAGATGPIACFWANVTGTCLSQILINGGYKGPSVSAPYFSQTYMVGTGGVTANKIVGFDASSNAISTANSTSFGGIAASTQGAGANVEIIRSGVASCVFDGAAVIGDIAVPSATSLGECHDSGQTSTLLVSSVLPIVGAIQTTVAAAGASGSLRLHGPGSFGLLAANNPISGASAEYPMTEGTGTVVHDISGNGNNAAFTSANPPTWYSYGVNFNDTTAGVSTQTITTPLTNFGTVYIGYCTPTMVQTSGPTSAPVPAQSGPAILGPSATASGISLLATNATFNYHNAPALNVYADSITNGGNYAGAFVTALPDAYGGCHVYGLSVGTSGSTVDHITVDGVEPANYVTQGASAAYTSISGGTYLIGNTSYTALNQMRGVVDYLIAYPTAHTIAQMQQVSSYIQNQLNARLTFPHYPHINNSRGLQAVMVGDSATATYNPAGPGTQWSSLLTLNNFYNVTNWGVLNLVALDMCKISDQRWASQIVPGQTIMQFWAGTNDLAAGDSPADTVASLAECAQRAHQLGARAIVATMMDREAVAVATKHSFNALVRANYKAIGFDYLNDIAMLPQLGGDGASASTACFQSDEAHPTGPGTGTCVTLGGNALSGYSAVAYLVSAAVNMADGYTLQAPHQVAGNSYAETAADNYIIQTPTAAGTITLMECEGRTMPTSISNGASAYALTASGTNSETITGSVTIAGNTTAQFTPILTSVTAGGCFWQRTQ